MKANIGISEQNTRAVAEILNKVLADEHLLYMKTRNYHWNIEGKSFLELHKFYEGQYKEIEEIIDLIAERIRYIGHYAEGRLKDFLKITHIAEEEYTNDQRTQIENLLRDHESIIVSIRPNIDAINDEHKDAGTADFITGIMEQHEKMAWFLRSYLK